MKITGIQLKMIIKVKQLELNTLISQFDENLYQFEGEEKINPISILEESLKIEYVIAKLQECQSIFNLNNSIFIDEINPKPITLELAIKLIGGYGRSSKILRDYTRGEKLDKYDRRSSKSRQKDEEFATRTISKDITFEKFKLTEKIANKLRNAIMIANSKEIDLIQLDEISSYINELL